VARPFTQPRPGPPREERLTDLFEAAAALHGERPALEGEGLRLTYRDLDAASSRLARLLAERGAGPGVHVGILLPRSPAMIIAVLAVLKAGAAYVPLDPEYPPGRVEAILGDAGARLLVSDLGLSSRIGLGPWDLVLPDREGPALDALPCQPVPQRAGPGDPCYAIFTSGSTGRPKGVSVSHRAACNLVRAEGWIFGVEPEDRVYQGFSLAFDASVEEIWLAFHAGACLVVADAMTARSGPLLPAWLREKGITVLSTVPTVLGTFREDVSGLGLLIVGGEACPPDLAARWAPGRRMVNTYGPTEATVIATWTDLEPGGPVTIGRAIPNLRALVLDEALHPVPPGEEGELCLAGAGLALGYLGRPDLTAERFPTLPDGLRVYRTGDRVREEPGGDLAFLGRMDAQVKLRGFRIELGEVEAALRLQEGVLEAAAAVHPLGGAEALVGYVVPRPGAAPADGALRQGLRALLPPYMVPSRIVTLEALPLLPSGKLDRGALPPPPGEATETEVNPGAFATETEAALAAAWARAFHRPVGPDDDFFTDLGGHSLLAAVMVSALRARPGFGGLSVPDVYAFPTVRALAAELDRREPAAAPQPSAPPLPGRGRRWRCHAAQFAGLYPLLAHFGLQWLAPYLTYSWLIDHDWDRIPSLAAALGVVLVLSPAMFILSIAAKWILLGRVRPGEHRLWGFYHWRWWLATRIQAATPTGYLVGTPWMRLYLRLMGARIGPHAHFASDSITGFDLVAVGADTCIGVDARLEAHVVEDGVLRLGEIRIGSRCCVGARAVVSPGASMGDDSELGDLGLLPGGAALPAGERWSGSPARPDPGPLPARGEPDRPGRARIAAMAAAQGVAAFLVPVTYLLAILPGMLFLNELWIRIPGFFGYLWAVPLAALSYVVLLALVILAVKRLVLPRARPGTYGLHSLTYLRKWFVDQLLEVSLDLLGPLYATLYLNPWYRALGARIGRRAEISTAGAASPDLLEIGEETFIADAVSLGTPRYDRGRVTLAPTRVGRRAFVGNSASVPGGTALGDLALVGVLSAPPRDPADAARVDASWLGNPPIFLPRRARAEGFREEETFRPSRSLVARRLAIEYFRVTLPATGYALLTCLLLTTLTVLEERLGLARTAALFPLLYLAAGLGACAFAVAAKWILMGRYRPGEKPLWCGFVWRTELVTALHENLAVPWLMALAQGTPLVPLYFRALGARVGPGAHMETTWLTEWDLVEIGAGACLGPDCTIQTHLFEDRVMKMSSVHIGAGCAVGADAVVLYDTRMEAGSRLGGLSLLMKGEELPAGTVWQGSPARRVG